MKRRGQGIAVSEEEKVIPVVQEKIKVAKQVRITGTIRVTKLVHEVPTVVDEPLREEEVVINRVPVNEFVDAPPVIREQSGTTIIPVMEEVLVVEKRLLLKEELHVSKRSRIVHKPETISLRSEEVIVERLKHGLHDTHENKQASESGKAAEKGGKE